MPRIDLNGAWRLGWRNAVNKMALQPTLPSGDDSLFIDAIVPGEVHLDLMRAGLIEDPNVGLNSLAARWVEECLWWYRREFDVPADALRGRAWLVFEQLDLDARVFLNGGLVGQHRNSFRPLRLDVTGRLKKGRNQITVEIESGLFSSGERAIPGRAIEDFFPADRLTKRQWLRKPSYQFGWDWADRYLNVGIGGDAYILHTEADAIVHQLVPLVDVAADLQRATVRARLVVEGLRAEPTSVTLTASVADAIGRVPVLLTQGVATYEVILEVPNPELWWPAGHGAQVLHELVVELTGSGTNERRTASIGFRRFEVNQDPHPDGGRFFVLHVNNRPIFCKGSNIAPLDMIPVRVDRARYEALIDLAREAHFNFIRVNGVGIYESDYFYDLCDRFGILVWQEFTLSCAQYPGTDQEFLDDFHEEAVHQVRRLASHPSLVVWCGNNENEWIFWDRERDHATDLPDNHVYHIVLPRVLAAEDPTRFYVPSSPYSPDGLFPNASEVGDQHPWDVGMGNSDIRDYRQMTCRFPDEGGIIGPAALPTIEACLPEGQRHMRSIAWHMHDNTFSSAQPSHYERILRELAGLEPRSMTIDEYAYWGGLIQGEGLREYVENFRRRMFDSAAACTWSFNDCWPTTRGWTVTDYFQRRTPGFWPVRRAMAPVTVVVARDGETVNVYGVNDTPEEVRAELLAGFFRTDGRGEPETMQVTLAANASTLLHTLGTWRGDPVASIAFASLRQPDQVDARSRLILPLFRELEWAAPQLSVRVEGGNAVFESETFVWGVCLDLSGERALPDNFFDVWPGMPYVLPWVDATPPNVLHIGNLGPGQVDRTAVATEAAVG